MRDLYAHYALRALSVCSRWSQPPLPKGEARNAPVMPLAPFQKSGEKRSLHGLGSPFGRAGAKAPERACTQKSICSEHCRCFSFCLFAYFFKYSSHPEEVTTCWSVVHQRASTPSRLSTIFCPSSSGIQNRPVVRQSARPESLHSTVTLLK